MSLSQSYDREFFDAQSARSRQSARVVLGEVLPLLQPRSLIDIGCGVGSWLRAAIDLGVENVVGIDGDYVDRSALMVEERHFLAADLATAPIGSLLQQRGTPRFDLALSVEVAEHLPFERAASFVREIAALSDVVLFSAAMPFQFGERHVNEQWPEFWAILFRAEGFVCFDYLRDRLWSNPEVDWWYAQNALIFAREGSEAARRLPADSLVGRRNIARVHPQNLLTNVLSLPRRYRLDASQEEFTDLQTIQAAHAAGAVNLPHLVAPARAAEASHPRVFPYTRLETYEPEQEIAALRAEVGELNQRVWQVGDYLRVEKVAHDETREAAARHGRARLEAESRLADAQEKIASQHGEIDALVAARAVLVDQVAAGEALAATLRSDVADRQALEREIARLFGEIDALHASPIWRTGFRLHRLAGRVPRPLRRLLRLAWRVLRRLLGRPAAVTPAPAVLAAPPPVVEAVPTHETMPLLPAPDEAPDADPDATEGMLDTSWTGGGTALICSFGTAYGRVNWQTLATGIERLRRFDLFDEGDYFARNPDVRKSGMDAFSHFLQAGALENRGRTDLEELARVTSGVLLFENAAKAEHQAADDYADLPDLLRAVGPIGIYVSSFGNLFMTDIAEDLARDLASVGAEVQVLDETSRVEDRPRASLFVAPHEFFILGKGTRWVRDDVLSTGFMFSTEQAQTKWFQISLPFILMSRGVLDLCAQTAQLLAHTGMPALHLLPGCSFQPAGLTESDKRHALFQVLPPAAQADPHAASAFADRPLDIAFFGNSSPKRDRFFGRNARFFSDYETFNYCRRAERGPLLGRGEESALTRLAAHVSGHAKITLNIHRDDFGYFEWHRMVRLGMCSGSVVVSDPCLPHPDFIAGTHYFQEQTRHIPDLLEWLLRTEDGQREAERVRANVDDLLTNRFDKRHTAATMLRFLAAHQVQG